MNTKDIIKEGRNLEDLFDFTVLDRKHEFFSNKNKKVVRKFNIKTPKNIWTVEFICLRSKTFTFNYGDYHKNNLKCFSETQTKHIKFEENEKCLHGEQYQRECNKSFFKLIDHEI